MGTTDFNAKIAVTMTALIFLLLCVKTFGQQPGTQPTAPIYDACWKIESNPPCEDTYYVDNLGCHYDTYDASCMCRITENNINVIYLADITTNAVPISTEFSYIAHLIQDVTDSTLLTPSNDEIFNQIILYDQNQYAQTANINAESIGITQYTRTQLNDLQTAISTAVQTFETLYGKRRVLVIFNGQMQKDYTQDDVNICSLKATLDNAGITVIVVSYTPYDITETARDLTCLTDETNPLSYDAYNLIPYAAILQAPETSWNGFPIEAKLSWDLCETARVTPEPTPSTTEPPTQTTTTTPPPQSTKDTSVVPTSKPPTTTTTTTTECVCVCECHNDCSSSSSSSSFSKLNSNSGAVSDEDDSDSDYGSDSGNNDSDSSNDDKNSDSDVDSGNNDKNSESEDNALMASQHDDDQKHANKNDIRNIFQSTSVIYILGVISGIIFMLFVGGIYWCIKKREVKIYVHTCDKENDDIELIDCEQNATDNKYNVTQMLISSD